MAPPVLQAGRSGVLMENGGKYVLATLARLLVATHRPGQSHGSAEAGGWGRTFLTLLCSHYSPNVLTLYAMSVTQPAPAR